MQTTFKRTIKSSIIKREYRNHLLSKYKHCRYCGIKLNRATATIDHYLPKNSFPHLKHNKDNFVLACEPCNRRKSGMHPDDFLALLKEEQVYQQWLAALPVMRMDTSWRSILAGVRR